MSLINLQQALAGIYTNSKLRNIFLTNPDIVGKSLGLDCHEILQLSQLSSQQVNLFASSLKRKRLGEIRKLLPLTNKILGKEFDRLFFSFAETYLPSGSKKHLLDSIAFSEFLPQHLTPNHQQPIYLLDILRYEAIKLKMFQGRRLVICDRFSYHPESLVNSLHAGSQSALDTQPVIGIWFKLTPNSQWRSLFIKSHKL